MNYIIEVNDFNRFCEVNHISTNAQLIWFKLMDIANSTRWKEVLRIENKRIMDKAQIKREKTFIDNRKELISYGLIEYKRGCKGLPGRYKLVSIKTLLGDFSEAKTEAETEVITEAETEDLYKEKEKKKVCSALTDSPFSVFETLWKKYPHKRNKTRVLESRREEIESTGFEVLNKALDRYISYVESERGAGFNLKYQDGCNWFNYGYKDYMEEEAIAVEPKREIVFKDTGYL